MVLAQKVKFDVWFLPPLPPDAPDNGAHPHRRLALQLQTRRLHAPLRGQWLRPNGLPAQHNIRRTGGDWSAEARPQEEDYVCRLFAHSQGAPHRNETCECITL